LCSAADEVEEVLVVAVVVAVSVVAVCGVRLPPLTGEWALCFTTEVEVGAGDGAINFSATVRRAVRLPARAGVLRDWL
jgi:hypothetical protein